MLSAGALSLSLGGCFQAQLRGPVAGAQITVTELRDPSVVHVQHQGVTAESVIAEKGQAEWDSFGDLLRLLHFGVVTDKIANPPADTLFLVSSQGGTDQDWNMDRKPDGTPVSVTGRWHAIVPGAVINNPEIKVSPLTEAVYQWLAPQLEQLDDEQLLAAMNRAATQLVGDVDGSGSVDYTDLLEWSRLLGADAELLRGDRAVLNQLASAIRNDQPMDRRRELAVALIGEPSPGALSADEHFSAYIADDVLAARCFACHVDGGVADNGGARLIFDDSGGAEAEAANILEFEQFIEEIEGGDQLILSKVQGVGHGGGAVFNANSQEFAAISTYLGLLTNSDGTGDNVAGQFWDGVDYASAKQTLRRAALIFAGRLPTTAEYDEAAKGDGQLRTVIRGLMRGDGFHDFLIRGSNDRLHTDAYLNGRFFDVSDISANSWYPEGANFQEAWRPQTEEEQREKQNWWNGWTLGLARAPLELIAYVVKRDRPYTEILTANHTMVNPVASLVLRSGVTFKDENDYLTFKPGKNRGQIKQDDALVDSYTFEYGTRVEAHSGFIDYPHAGILNTQAFLDRYPTTETNRNRARARWTYYHFLGVDIEKSAARTTDPEALADTNNPTLNNPACTVCHTRMDPVAGAFQNYGNEGWYRDKWGGNDSLPDTYKYPEWFEENPEPSPYREGDTWFRDMRAPGFEGQEAPNKRSSLAWLAREITADPRFATASIKFWWPAVMGAEPLEAPATTEDNGYQQKLNAFNQQQADIEEMAEGFRTGFDGGDAYNARDLFVEMAMSGWFRANSADSNERELELDAAGTRRLLTPSELENKLVATLGMAPGVGNFEDWAIDGKYTDLRNIYRIYYGGIDSIGILERSRQLTSLMSNVASRLSVSTACAAVVTDFVKPDRKRLLFDGLSKLTTPGLQGSQTFTVGSGWYGRTRHNFNLDLTAGKNLVQLQFLTGYYDEASEEGSVIFYDKVVLKRSGRTIATFEGENFRDIPGFEYTIDYGENGEVWESGNEHFEGAVNDTVAWATWSNNGITQFPIDVPDDGNYTLEVTAFGQQVPSDSAQQFALNVSTPDFYANSTGTRALKRKIQELHSRLLGEDLPLNDPEIEATYQLLVESWQERVEKNYATWDAWNWPDEDCLNLPEAYWEIEDWEQRVALYGDPMHMKGAWTSVMLYLLTTFEFLHE